MTKYIVIAALTLGSASAYASKARTTALGDGLTTADDIQDVFTKPSRISSIPDQAVFEFGTNNHFSGASSLSANRNPNAEGGFVRTYGDMKYGFYLGRQSTTFNQILSGLALAMGGSATAGSFIAKSTGNLSSAPATVGYTTANRDAFPGQQNPINLMYGMKMSDMEIGANLYYASGRRNEIFKSNFLGLSAGAKQAGVWEANLTLGLGAKIENDGSGTAGANTGIGFDANDAAGAEILLNRIEGKSSWALNGSYTMGDNYFYLDYSTAKGEAVQDAAASPTTYTADLVGYNLAYERKDQGEGVHFFYGAKYSFSSVKLNVTGASNNGQVESTTLPLYMGAEVDASSWLVLRGSIRQNFLISSRRVVVQGAADGLSDQPAGTQAALGAGLKFGKLLVDGTMSSNLNGTTSTNTANTGVLNLENPLANVSMTYTF